MMSIKLFLILTMIFLVSCEMESKKEVKQLATSSVVKKDIKIVLKSVGRTEFLKQESVISPNNLTVLKLNVSRNQMVKEGETLIVLDPSNAHADIKAKERELFELRSRKKTALIRLNSLKTDLRKTKRLFRSGALSRDEKDKKEEELLIKKNEWNVLLTNEDDLIESVDKLKRTAEKLTIKAKYSGIITKVWTTKEKFLPGTSIKKGDLLFKLAFVEKAALKINLEERAVVHFSQGQSFDLHFPSLPKEKVKGVVSNLDHVANIDKNTGLASFKMLIEFTPPKKFRAGMEASIELLIDSKDKALTVPKMALNPISGESPEVILVRGGKKELKKIKIGLIDEVDVEVLEGLNEGDTVLAVFED